jgi:hypothetical protein
MMAMVLYAVLRRSNTQVPAGFRVSRWSSQAERFNNHIFQQHLRYIQNTGLPHSPSHLFVIDFIAQLQTWQRQGDRLLIFIDMNEHILRGQLAKYMSKMGLTEATHSRLGKANEPHTYFRGTEPIDGVWHSPSLDVVATLQLSFHEGVGNHRTALVEIPTSSAIGKQEFRVVHPAARRLSSGNKKAREKYLAHFERQMEIHRMSERLQECKRQAIGFPASEVVHEKMQLLDTQVVKIQRGARDNAARYSEGQSRSASQSARSTLGSEHIRSWQRAAIDQSSGAMLHAMPSRQASLPLDHLLCSNAWTGSRHALAS